MTERMYLISCTDIEYKLNIRSDNKTDEKQNLKYMACLSELQIFRFKILHLTY